MANYFTTAEAAAQLRLTQESVRDLCRKGRLSGAIKDPKKGSWLIPQQAITDWMATSALTGRALRQASAGDTIQVGNVTESNVAIGRGAQVIVSESPSDALLENLFERVFERIEARPDDLDVDKKEIAVAVENIQAEASKGEDANPRKVERWLKMLAVIAPDILDVVLAALLSPTAAIAAVVRKVAERAKQDLPE